MAQDVFKMLKDLELKAVGLDEQSKKMQEGYFVAFRSIGLPIHKQDYENPWSPLGVNLEKDIPKTDSVDPKNAPKTGSDKSAPTPTRHAATDEVCCLSKRRATTTNPASRNRVRTLS